MEMGPLRKWVPLQAVVKLLLSHSHQSRQSHQPHQAHQPHPCLSASLSAPPLQVDFSAAELDAMGLSAAALAETGDPAPQTAPPAAPPHQAAADATERVGAAAPTSAIAAAAAAAAAAANPTQDSAPAPAEVSGTTSAPTSWARLGARLLLRDMRHWSMAEAQIGDAGAVAAVIDPSVLTTRRLHVAMELNGLRDRNGEG